MAAALAAAISDETLCGTVSEVRLGDSTPDDRMATSAAIEYIAGGEKRTTQYVPATAHSLFQRGKEKEFDRRSLRPSIGQETFITDRFLARIARDFKEAKHFNAQEETPKIAFGKPRPRGSSPKTSTYCIKGKNSCAAKVWKRSRHPTPFCIISKWSPIHSTLFSILLNSTTTEATISWLFSYG